MQQDVHLWAASHPAYPLALPRAPLLLHALDLPIKPVVSQSIETAVLPSEDVLLYKRPILSSFSLSDVQVQLIVMGALDATYTAFKVYFRA